MRKSILKRLKITRKNKFLKRIAGQNHFRAKKSGKIIRNKRKIANLSSSIAKSIKHYMAINYF